MTALHPSRRRRAALALALAGASVAATLAPTSPAGATTAPLETVDGIGVRLDDVVFTGPELAAVETEIQPFVDGALSDRAEELSPPGTAFLDVSSDVTLALDLVDAGSLLFPAGGMRVEAAVTDLELHYVVLGWWGQCDIWVSPKDATVEATAPIDRDLLPDVPLGFGAASGEWDADPDVSASGICGFLISDDWFEDLFGSGPGSVAAIVEGEVVDGVQDLVEGLWGDVMVPALGGLDQFETEFGQVRTDDHGLVVTLDTDASGGLVIPGGPPGLYDVSDAADAGVTIDVGDLLGQQVDGAIVTIHPNLANQMLDAVTQGLNGNLGTMPVSAAIEDALLDKTVHGFYADAGWTVTMSVPSGAPSAHPTGPDGLPELRFDPVDLTVRNSAGSVLPVAIFRGSVTNTHDPASATVSLTRIYGNAHVLAFDADPSVMTPYARDAVDGFMSSWLSGYPSLGPTSLGGGLGYCAACPRRPKDERYTGIFLLP